MIMNCTWGLNAVKIAAAIMLLNASASAQTYVKYKPNNNWKYVHKDYKIKFGPAVKDTMIIIDPINGDEIMRETTTDPKMELANNKKVFYTDELSSSVQNGESLEKYLLENLSSKIKSLKNPNGDFIKINLNHIVVNENGMVIYYEYDGVDYKNKDGKITSAPIDLAADISTLMSKHPKLVAATVEGKYVTSQSKISLSDYKITVSNDKVFYNKG
jgi:hypothetical protein